MLLASQIAYDYGASVLCVHVDADDKTSIDVYSNKINPFLDSLGKQKKNEFCQVIVPIIPVRMTEAWMLADTELLKEKIGGRNMLDIDLGLHRQAESYADPKAAIEHAIQVVQKGKAKKRRNDISISDLYSEISLQVSLDKLRRLDSFIDFEKHVRNAFVKLNYL